MDANASQNPSIKDVKNLLKLSKELGEEFVINKNELPGFQMHTHLNRM